MSLALDVQLFIDSVWTTFKGLSDVGWKVQIGPDVESGSRPNKIEYRFDNDVNGLDPYDPTSALYGKISLNSRLRLRIAGSSVTWAEASDWQPDATEEWVSGSRGLAWTDIVAEGLLRRIGRWTDPLDSAMRRQISSYSLLNGYWPLEDVSGAANLTQLVPPNLPGTFSGTVTLAGDAGAGGSDKTLTIGTGAILGGYFKSQAASGYQIVMHGKLAAVPSTATNLPYWAWVDSAGRRWTWGVTSTTFNFDVVDSGGTSLVSTSALHGIAANQWLRMRMKVTVSGATVTYEPAWYAQDALSVVGITGTFASSTAGQPRSWSVVGNAWTNNAAFGHLFATSDTALDLVVSYDATASFNGYLNEPAGKRWLRLLSEQGFARYIDGVAADTVPMGRQKPGVLLDLLEECVRTEGGIMFDEPLDIALTMRTRAALSNRTAAIALTKTVNIVSPLRRRIDDVGVINYVTVNNSDGSSAAVEKSSGPKSVLPPPAGVGRYKASVDVNMADVTALTDRASWEVNKGTIDRPRYDQVTVDLLKNPSLTGSVTTLRPGDWLSIAGAEPDTLMLRVISWQRTGGPVKDTVVFNCLPADVYQVGIFDTALNLATSYTTTLNAGYSSSATTLVLTTADPLDVWSTAGGYDLLIAGERIGVPAAGMGAVSGAGPYLQTITGAVRSKNGVVKAQLAGAAVDVWPAVRFGL